MLRFCLPFILEFPQNPVGCALASRLDAQDKRICRIVLPHQIPQRRPVVAAVDHMDAIDPAAAPKLGIQHHARLILRFSVEIERDRRRLRSRWFLHGALRFLVPICPL